MAVRHQQLLNEIREQHARKDDFDGRLASIAVGEVRGTQGPADRDRGTDEEPRREIEAASRIILGSDQQRGGNDGPDEHESQGDSPDTAKTRRSKRQLTAAEQAAEEERQKELARARQRRYEERKKQEQEIEQETIAFSGDSELILTSERHRHSQSTPDGGKKKNGIFSNATKSDDVEVKAKQPKKDYADVKLLTNAEAIESRDKLIDLYIRASSMIDKLIQIVVKGHEEVRIWELSEFEAGMLADMQLEKAKKDKATAHLVKQLVGMHERLFMMTLASGRVVATGIHVTSHGGFGFR